jgi:hypothetical protein
MTLASWGYSVGEAGYRVAGQATWPTRVVVPLQDGQVVAVESITGDHSAAATGGHKSPAT